jgi:cell wall assembly regulator SMI1
MSSILEITKAFKDVSEWVAFCHAQSVTILNQTKEINELKDKNHQLERMLMDNTPLISKEGITTYKDLSDEEAIAVMELAKLREISMDRELTSDECKRYDTYTKNLLVLRSNKKKPVPTAESLSKEQLLTLVTNQD